MDKISSVWRRQCCFIMRKIVLPLFAALLFPTLGFAASDYSLSQPNQTAQSASAQTVVITNSGAISHSITAINLTGDDPEDFSQNSNCVASLAAGSTCSINATFTPTAIGSRSGNITITGDASGSPQAVALFGIGTSPTPPPSYPRITQEFN